ncbi:MAG: DNA polymerase III subunit alpha [Bacteroidota bacterium]
MYINAHTYFSLRYGTLSVEQLVAWARQQGVKQLALTDIHSTSACYDFVRLCREAGIDPVVGMEFRNGDELLYIALARNLHGFREINAFYSQVAHREEDFPSLPPYWNDVYVIYPWERKDHVSLSEHEFLGIRPSQVRQLLRSRYRHRPDHIVMLQPLTFLDKRGHNMHRLLRAIDHNILLSKLMKREQAREDEYCLPPDQLREAFADYPEIIRNTEQLLSQCSFPFVFEQRRSRQSFTGGKYEDMLLLEKLALEGLERRYGKHHREAHRRLKHELEIIDQLDFNAYFLITWDFVSYGQSRGFFHVGRGSGANSITAYCLGLTDVDPIQLDLYFERFLNPKRTSPPDFDIDYSWQDRDAVIDYVFKRYRHSHTAMLATYNCFRGRASIRELGKVFGLPKREIDKLVASRKGLGPKQDLDKMSRQVLHYASLLEGFPNHLSVHAGGILISEEPMHSFTATDLPPKGFPITHFDMYVAEEVGLHKFDVLSQRGLGHIRDGVDIVQENQGKSINIRRVEDFKVDPEVKKLLAEARTVGCFYIESPAMRGLLTKLQCEDYLTLVAASSVIRPGVARSGMMRSFIERHNGRLFTYPHPKLKELLGETYGVMVYQEDVIKVAHGFGGLGLAEADMLRRAMSGKTRNKNTFQLLEEDFLTSCKAQGHDMAVSQEIWRQIASFAGYSFSKAHSASFAVESFQSLYLKAYYPLEFMTAVINNFGGFYDTEIYLHEARMWGARVHPPCVNESRYLTCLKGQDMYLGFVHLKDLESKLAKEIAVERQRRGPFRSLIDFARRLPIGEEQLTILARIGAFRFTGRTKHQLLWDIQLHVKRPKGPQQADRLFADDTQKFSLPVTNGNRLEDAYDEMELLGFPLCSPFSLVPNLPADCVPHQALPERVGQTVRMLGYMICVKTTKTVKGDAMQFANFLDPEGAMFDVTLFPPEVKKYPFVGRGVYLLAGKVVKEFGHYSLELQEMKKLLFQRDPRQADVA